MTAASTKSPPELLAPAGSLEAFFAAMDFGADAVYVGLREFSARAKAKNVSRDELERMTGYAHARQRKVYLTLNTLVKEKELSHLIDILAAVEAIGVDAVILQDLGVWRLARRHFPGLELHASTQLTIHNAAGVRMAEQMGFSRAVLARELSLAEIAAIRRATRLDLEHFVHGAHCFCLSGQCSFSSWLGGMSGNRGRCAQPCRRRYRYRDRDGYYFSPNDLSAIELLPELAAAGVMSFKIEGRMKSAEYVARVVQAYRLALDAAAGERSAAVSEAKALLRESFGRTPTRGFLPGEGAPDMVNPALHGATGLLIGSVEQCRGQRLHFTPRQPLHLGDRLRIQPASDKPGTAFTVREMFLGKRPVNRVEGGERVAVGSPPGKSFGSGDLVFKVSSGQAFNLSQSACRKRLETVVPGEAVVDLEVAMPSASQLKLSARAQGLHLARSFAVETFPASERPLSGEVLRKALAKTGALPLQLGRLDCGPLPQVVLPLSRLNAIRREFYGELAGLLEARRQEARTDHRRRAMAELLPAEPPREQPALCGLAVGGLRELSLLRNRQVDELLLPLRPGAVDAKRLAGTDPERVVWELPLALFDDAWEEMRETVSALYRQGFRRFRLNNLGQFHLFEGLEGVRPETGFRLFGTNSQALCAWRELGATAATLYVEDDRDNLAQLLARRVGLPLAVTVYANLPLMISRVALRGIREDRPLASDRQEHYRVESRQGLTLVRPEQDFSLLGHLGELRRLGCSRFIIDLAHCGAASAQGRAVLEAAARDLPVAGTSTFNYLQELT